MKAVVYTKYGSPDVLEFKEVETPIPKDNEVLVKVCAASVNAGDWHLLRGKPFPLRLVYGILKPKINILGADVAGTVEAVGKNVKAFKPGDEVFGDLAECGFGTFAEFVCSPESALALKPANISFEEAAAVPAAAFVALQALRTKGRIQAGQKVLINGASGGVGTFAVQIAKSFGAIVTAVCSGENLEKARSLGADYVIDYTKENFTKNGEHYDLIVAANGNYSIWDYKRSLTTKGIYVMTGGANTPLLQAVLLGPLISMFSGNTMSNMLMHPNKTDLLYLRDLLESGKIKPVIDRRYSLKEVPDAIRYVEAGHAKGKVVITIEDHNKI